MTTLFIIFFDFVGMGDGQRASDTAESAAPATRFRPLYASGDSVTERLACHCFDCMVKTKILIFLGDAKMMREVYNERRVVGADWFLMQAANFDWPTSNWHNPSIGNGS